MRADDVSVLTASSPAKSSAASVGAYGSKVWNSTSKYRRVIWQCNHKYGRKGKSEANHCTTPHLTENQLKSGFMTMVNNLLTNKDEIIALYRDMLAKLTDTRSIEAEITAKEGQLTELNDRLRAWINENARRAMDQDEYNQRYDELADQATIVTARINTLKDKMLEMQVKREKANAISGMIENCGLDTVLKFDESLFGAIVDTITVHVGKLVFQLKDGTERETAL